MTQEEEAATEAANIQLSEAKSEPSVAARSHPICHPPVDAPLCEKCKQMELVFLDPQCPSCYDKLVGSETTIAELFAVMRQWIPQAQQSIDLLVNEVLKRGAHVDERDGLTDMTLLHFACKAGAAGVGDAELATKVVSMLLQKGANVHLCCRWTNMTALHYSSYFGVSPVLRLLLTSVKDLDINRPCSDFENGTALHIAASNLCLDGASVLLEFNANPAVRDDLGRTPAECLPELGTSALPDITGTVSQLLQMLQNAEAGVLSKEPTLEGISGRALLKSMGMKLGDTICVGANKTGILRFCGTTEFATGIWAGIELDTATGKNNGSVKGVMYFKCPPNHGIFSPIDKISSVGSPASSRKPSSRGSPMRTVNHPRVDLSKVTSKVETGRHRQRSPCSDPGSLEVGERVIVAGRRKGTIRFSGETQFAPGWWYGVELDAADGKNDGSVQNVSYFKCNPNHGVFAPPSRITKMMAISDEYLSDMTSSLEGASGGTYNLSPSLRSTPDSGSSKSPLTRHSSFRSPNRLRNSRLRSSLRHPKTNDKTENEPLILEGMDVTINNLQGKVRYIGPADFADGKWVGIELSEPKGKNDGSVKGKHYFTCAPNHGLMVRPHKVIVCNQNGTKQQPQSQS